MIVRPERFRAELELADSELLIGDETEKKPDSQRSEYIILSEAA